MANKVNGVVLWKVASPMIGLGLVMTTLGGFAAWNIQLQQRSTAEAIVHEVHSLAATSKLFLVAREIRYQLSLYLRTRQPQHLDQIQSLSRDAEVLITKAQELTVGERETHLVNLASEGYHRFATEFKDLDRSKLDEQKLLYLLDELLTKQMLEPLNTCMTENEAAVNRTNDLGRASTQQLARGLWLLGITGGAAGILVGVAVARGIGRSIVQLDISVQSVASRIASNKNRVSFTRVGDISGIESNLRSLEGDIERVVETLQQQEIELLRNEQLARVGQMAAGLAHELRNPLMPMKMLVQAALHPDGKGQLSQRSLQILNDEILRLEETIQSFLDFARPRLPSRAPLEMRQFLTRATSFISEKAKALDIEIDLKLPDTDVVAEVDQNQMRQLFLNLANNAMDAIGSTGQVEIRLEQARYTDAHDTNLQKQAQTIFHGTDLLSAPVTDWIVITFLDSGPGIDPSIAETLFEPFVTTKETGTGLGLSICQQIAEAHGGVLRAANRTDRTGAEFKLMIPQTGR